MESTDSPSDTELVGMVSRGEDRALGWLFERHHRSAYAMAYRMLGDSSSAEDVTQDVFMRIRKYARTFQGRSSVKTWILTITRNSCLETIERARSREKRESDYLMDQSNRNTEGSEDPRVASLELALRQLPEDRRELIVMARFHGMKYSELAEMLGTTVGAIKVRMHRAVNELRELVLQIESGT